MELWERMMKTTTISIYERKILDGNGNLQRNFTVIDSKIYR